MAADRRDPRGDPVSLGTDAVAFITEMEVELGRANAVTRSLAEVLSRAAIDADFYSDDRVRLDELLAAVGIVAEPVVGDPFLNPNDLVRFSRRASVKDTEAPATAPASDGTSPGADLRSNIANGARSALSREDELLEGLVAHLSGADTAAETDPVPSDAPEDPDEQPQAKKPQAKELSRRSSVPLPVRSSRYRDRSRTSGERSSRPGVPPPPSPPSGRPVSGAAPHPDWTPRPEPAAALNPPVAEASENRVGPTPEPTAASSSNPLPLRRAAKAASEASTVTTGPARRLAPVPDRRFDVAELRRYVLAFHDRLAGTADLRSPKVGYPIPGSRDRIDVLFRARSTHDYVICQLASGSGTVEDVATILRRLDAVERLAHVKGIGLRGILISQYSDPKIDRELREQARGLDYRVDRLSIEDATR